MVVQTASCNWARKSLFFICPGPRFASSSSTINPEVGVSLGVALAGAGSAVDVVEVGAGSVVAVLDVGADSVAVDGEAVLSSRAARWIIGWTCETDVAKRGDVPGSSGSTASMEEPEAAMRITLSAT